VHADCFRRREFEAASIDLDREFAKTALNVSLDDVDIFRPIADQEIIHIQSGPKKVITLF